MIMPCVNKKGKDKHEHLQRVISTYEPHHEKTGFLHMRKQRRRSAFGNREADQRLCFRYIDITVPLLSKSKILSF